MGSSHVHHGYSSFALDSQEPTKHGNLTHPFNHQHIFESYVRTGRWANYLRYGLRLPFRRHSALRPYVQNLRHRGRLFDFPEVDSRSWEAALEFNAVLGAGGDGTAGSVVTNRDDFINTLSRTFGRTYTVNNYACAIGSMAISWEGSSSTQAPVVPNPVDGSGYWGEESVSEVDLPGNTIGNIFKHPYNRSAWFNETLIIPLSQGQINLGGAYNPPEHRLMHAGFQVYFARNGGTGVISGAVKTNGQTFPGGTSSSRFRDTVYAAFSGADVGRYIAIHGQGIYLITAFIDASNVDVDSAVINEPFVNQTGLTWTLRTGPIGEYFFRRRPYFKRDLWSPAVLGSYNMHSFVQMDERLAYDRTASDQIPQRVIYDGYSHWWWTTPNRVDKPYGIMRWLHMSPQPFQDVLNDGSITGLVQSTWGATAAAPLGQWEDIIVDQNKKLWFSCTAGQDDRYTLARMHPAPGGDASEPAVEAVWRKQQNAADASGLTSRSIIALCDDRSGAFSGGPGTHRIWAIGGNGEPGVGGLSYSDDDGTTWKRVHVLSAATGTATATNGSASVVGAGTTFTSQFAVGDWVRFGADARSYEIAAIADNLNLTLASNYAGVTGAGKTLQKGALAANQAVCRTGYSHPNSTSNPSDGQHNIDWDTSGRVYWISHSGQICRWSPGDGACISFAETAIPAVAPLIAIASGVIANLKVVRVPNPTGVANHPFHDEVWLGCSINGATAGGWIRVRGDQVWTASPTAVNFTRYHYNNSIVTNFPSIVLVPKDGAVTFNPCNTSVLVEPTTGNICLFASFGQGTPGWHWLQMSGSEPGTEYWRATQTMCYSPSRAATALEPWRRNAYDEVGMGLGCVISAQDTGAYAPASEPPLALNATCWVDRRWDGSQWRECMVSGSVWLDLNLRAGTNIRTRAAVLGNGFRRVHEWSEPLEDGMYISFLQAGGAVSQTDEFLADESATFVCCIGAVKDNTQTANVFYQTFVQPTVQRLCDESIKEIRNINTVDGGIEGGYTSSATGSLTFRPPFFRGVADAYKHQVGYGQALGFLSTNNQQITTVLANQATAVLRTPAIIELNTDGSWTGGTDLFNTAGGYVFTGADVGKSIFIEGANGASADDDNGQAVILAVNSATQVQVDKVFTTTRTAAAGRRWKLKDIPAVAFVEAGFFNTQQGDVKATWRHDLWSSSDHGNNWSLVKYSGQGTNSIPLNGPDDISPGVWYSAHNGDKSNAYISQANGNIDSGCSIIFDLRDLPENVRRRHYWRWRVYDPVGGPPDNSNFAGLHLYDDDFKFLGRPAESKIDDADDDVFFGCQVDKWQVIRGSGTGADPVDDGNADGLTNIVNVTGPLYTDTGVNDAQVTTAGRFIDPGAAFTRLIVGNYIRITGAANSANDGWALITGFVSATEVQTSKVFVNETNTFSWSLLPFGPGDELRIDSAEVLSTRGTPLEDNYFVISDVPSTTQFLVAQAEVKHPITAAAWDVGREINRSIVHDSSFSDWDTNNRGVIGANEGTMHFGYDLEFVTVQSSTVSATTPADDDGDGCTDVIVVGEALTAVDGPVVGDYIEIVHATYGRRVFEIAAITGSDPNRNIRVTYDEILPGIASGLTWTILRRRNLMHQVRRLTVVGGGTPVA